MSTIIDQIHGTQPASSESEARLVESYRDQIGRARSEVGTPALLLDLAAARRNIEAMAAAASGLGTRLRPHVKSHKCPHLARLQMAAGAIGVTCATAWEAVAMARAGIPDVLVANQVIQRDKLRALASLARGDCVVTVAVDDEQQIASLSQVASAAEAELGVVVEIDIGMGRAGVRSPEQALRLAEQAVDAPLLAFRGVHGYEGHCMLEPDATARQRAARAANRDLAAVAARLADAGLPCPIVTAGGTGTFRVTGADPAVTDLQVGSYVLMDAFHERLVPDTFELALTVAGTVTSRQGSTAVVDVGRKSASTEFEPPRLVGFPEATVRAFAEEHCILDFAGSSSLRLGDTVEIVAAYAPTTVNLHDVFHVLEDGIVVDIWPVRPRGPGPVD